MGADVTGLGFLRQILQADLVPDDGGGACVAVEPEPEGADALQSRLHGAANGPQLTGEQICLLTAHAFGAGPAQSQQKGRQAGLCHQLLQKLPHGDLRVQHRAVGTDDLDRHVTHSHEVPHHAVFGILHGRRPLPGDGLGVTGGGSSLKAVAGGLADHRVAHVARPLPVDAEGVVDLQQDVGQKGHASQQGDAVGIGRLRVEGGQKQQMLIGQRPQTAAFIRAADRDVQRTCALLDLQRRHVAPAESRQLPTRHHHLPDGSAVEQQRIQVGRQKAVDAELGASAGHRPQEVL